MARGGRTWLVSTILGVNRASQEFNLVEGILNVNTNVGLGNNFTVQTETSPDGKDLNLLSVKSTRDIVLIIIYLLGSMPMSSHHSMYSTKPIPLVSS